MLKIFKQYYPIRNLFFVIGEGLLLYASFLTASWLTSSRTGSDLALRIPYLQLLLVTAIIQLSLYYNDLYNLKVARRLSEFAIRLLQALGGSAILLAGFQVVFPWIGIRNRSFTLGCLLVIFSVVAWRIAYMTLLKRGMLNERILIVGSNDLARYIMNRIEDHLDCGYSVAAVLPEKFGEACPTLKYGDSPICQNSFEGLAPLVRSLQIKKIIVALSQQRGILPIQELLHCRSIGITILDGNSFYEMLTGKLNVYQVQPSWLIFSDGFRVSLLRLMIKRYIDLSFSFTLGILLLPLMLMTALAIAFESPGPILFAQERIGRKGIPYRMLKFRSMIHDAEKGTGPVWAQKGDQRTTRIGAFLRRWRLDELPQLWNVIQGEMSFVGPRPEREFFIKDLEKVIPYYRMRLIVKPGLTGWAQVNYGYGATLEDAVEKLNFDLFYIKNMSLFMDLMIVARTVKAVIFGQGVR